MTELRTMYDLAPCYVCGSNLEVPRSCFGLSFPLMVGLGVRRVSARVHQSIVTESLGGQIFVHQIAVDTKENVHETESNYRVLSGAATN